MGKTSRRELNAHKYKKYVGNKSEGCGFADVRKKQAMSKYHKVVTKERKNLGAWTAKLEKIYAETENAVDVDPLERFGTKKKKKKKKKNEESSCGDKEKCQKEVVSTVECSDKASLQTSEANTFSNKPSTTSVVSRGKKRGKKVSSFYREEKERQRKQEEKQKRQQEIEARQRAKEAAKVQHKRARRHRHRLLAKCNYKGQPNLASRVQLLLEQIVTQRGHTSHNS